MRETLFGHAQIHQHEAEVVPVVVIGGLQCHGFGERIARLLQRVLLLPDEPDEIPEFGARRKLHPRQGFVQRVVVVPNLAEHRRQP